MYMDTKKLNVKPETYEGYPLYWVNKPSSERDSVHLKYTSEKCDRCTATTPEGNRVAVSDCDEYGRGGENVYMYEMDTGTLVHHIQVEDNITSLSFTSDHTQLWVGDEKGVVHICDVTTGKEVVEKKKKVRGGKVIWLQSAEENMLCGTHDEGTVAIYSAKTNELVNTWKAGKWLVYCYHPVKQHILSAQYDPGRCFTDVKFWNMEGALINTIAVRGYVEGMNVQCTEDDDVVACALQGGEVRHVRMPSGEVVWMCKGRSEGYGSCRDVAFVCEGKRTACVAKDYKTIILLDGDGNIATSLKGHSSAIENMCVVPHSNQLLTAGRDGCYLFNIPPLSQQHDDEDTTTHRRIRSCCMLPSGEEFVTLSEEGRLQKWTTQTCATTPVYAEVQSVGKNMEK